MVQKQIEVQIDLRVEKWSSWRRLCTDNFDLCFLPEVLSCWSLQFAQLNFCFHLAMLLLLWSKHVDEIVFVSLIHI